MNIKNILSTTRYLVIGTMLTTVGVPTASSAEEDEILYWVAPMDQNYRRDKPGQSPMGMDLVPVYADSNAKAGEVSIAPEVVQNLGVRTALAERSRLWRGIDTVGYVNYDESMVAHIHLRTEGWIDYLATHSEGDRIEKGQLLLELYSPDLVNAQEEFVQALSSKNKRLIKASRARLGALGIPTDQVTKLNKTKKVQQVIRIYAPQDGVVAKLNVRHGMFVKPSNQVMMLADLSSVWILAEVFERQANWVKVGNPAEVELSYLPGKTLSGRVEYIYPSLDPKTRTLKVRLRFDNPDESLKPNMYANVKIFSGPKENVVVVPVETLIRTGSEERVVVSLGEGRFEARKVTAGIESGDWVEIIEGIDDGERVVTSGQFLIDSEASLRSSMMRMTPVNEQEGMGAMDMKMDMEKQP